MKMAKEDLLRLREICAEKGMELVPDEVLTILNEVKKVEVVDEPGLVSEIRRLRRDNGNPGTS